MGRPTSTNIGDETAELKNGPALMTGTVVDGKTSHVSEGLTPVVGLITNRSCNNTGTTLSASELV